MYCLISSPWLLGRVDTVKVPVLHMNFNRLIYLPQIIQWLPFINSTFFFFYFSGIYVPEDDRDAPEKFRGLGVRIEDDVVVTQGSPLILSADCPKEISDIEHICGRASWPHRGPHASQVQGLCTGTCAHELSECCLCVYLHLWVSLGSVGTVWM